MTSATRLATAAALVAVAGRAAAAQTLASRVSAAPDGRVQFTFAARPNVCGNGRTYIQTGAGSIYGVWNDLTRAEPCVPGPVRVVIDRADKLPLSVQTFVGPLDTPAAGVTDLGRVRAQEAADYLLSLANSVDGRAGRDAILPATLADSANTSPALLTIAKNTSLPRETRRSALSYLGRSTDGLRTIPASVTDAILAIAHDETDNQSVRQQALSVLGRLDHGAGIPPLIELSKQTQNQWLARESMSALARSGDPRAREYLRSAVHRTDLPEAVHVVALRALGQEYATARDAAVLRQVYPTLRSDRTREAVFNALADVGGSENTKWLLTVARDGNEPIAMRRRALEAANRAGAPIAELVKLYDTTTDPTMKETLIGIYIRNSEQASVDKLLSIIKTEENMAVRRRTISRLTSSDNPRIKQALQEIVSR